MLLFPPEMDFLSVEVIGFSFCPIVLYYLQVISTEFTCLPGKYSDGSSPSDEWLMKGKMVGRLF